MLIVFGLIAFDNALAILHAFPSLFPTVPPLPSPLLLVRALLVSSELYDLDRIAGLQEALARLRAKSRSFYLASGFFEGRLRIDLILLYVCSLEIDLHTHRFPATLFAALRMILWTTLNPPMKPNTG